MRTDQRIRNLGVEVLTLADAYEQGEKAMVGHILKNLDWSILNDLTVEDFQERVLDGLPSRPAHI